MCQISTCVIVLCVCKRHLGHVTYTCRKMVVGLSNDRRYLLEIETYKSCRSKFV